MITAILAVLSAYLIVNGFIGKSKFFERVALSYIIGTGLITYVPFLFYLAGMPISRLNFVLSWCCIFLFGLLVSFRKLRAFPVRIVSKNVVSASLRILRKFDVITYAIFFFGALLILFGAYWPVRDWDALTLYDFRAKIIVSTQSLSFLKSVDAEYYFAYPLFTSMAHAFTYLFDITSPMLMYSLFFIAFAIIYYFALVDETRNFFVSRASTLLLLSSPILFSHALLAYTNLPYSIFLALSLILLMRWSRSRHTGLVWLASLCAGLSVWSRGAEPFWLVVPLCVFLFARKRRFLLPLVSLVIILIFVEPWQIYSSQVLAQTIYVHSTQSVGVGVSQLTLSHILEVIVYLWKYFGEPYLGLHAILLVFVLQFSRKKTVVQEKLGLVFIAVLYAMIFAGTGYLSLIYPKWIIVGGSLERLSIFLIPIIYFFASSRKWFQYEKK